MRRGPGIEMYADRCPQLAGERVVLHPLRAEHADALFPILSDHELSRYTPRPRWSTLDELRGYYARLESRRSNDGLEHWLNWVIEDKNLGRIVGFVQATVDEALGSASVAYVVARSCWGQGLARDAVAAMLEYLKAIGVREIRATVDLRNERSIQLLNKLGFTIEDTRDPANVIYALSATATAMISEKWFPVQTERLLLREFTAADEANVHDYAADPLVSRYMEWGPNSPEITHQVLLRRMQEQQKWPRDEVTLAIELRAEGKLIGSFRLAIGDTEHGLADFGFVLNQRYWNRGYGTEATRAMLDTAFSVLKLHRLIATCDTRNVGSARVMEKSGMQREAHFRQDVFQKGEWRDTYLYAIVAPR